VTEQGDHDTLIAAGKRYAELFALQAARFSDSADTGESADREEFSGSGESADREEFSGSGESADRGEPES
jgi:ATP-binding cassette subfamily B protein